MRLLTTFILAAALVLLGESMTSEFHGFSQAYANTKKAAAPANAAKKSPTGGRSRIVTKEAKAKFTKKDKTNVNFDETTLEGRRLNPSGISLSLQKPDKEFDLIQLREHWKPEMIMSTSGLENR